MKSAIDTAAYGFPVHSHEVWCGASWKIGCKPCNGKVEIFGKSTTRICPWNFGNRYPMFRADDTMCLVFNFNQNATPVQTSPDSWSAGMFIINRAWFMAEWAVVLGPFIRSCLDTNMFNSILIRVKITIFYNCVLDIKDTSGFFNMLLLIYGVGLTTLCQKPHKNGLIDMYWWLSRELTTVECTRTCE